MNLELGDKTALITGSTAGIGYATALRLAQEGATVVVNGRSQERVDNAIATLKEQCPDASISGIAADLSSREGVYHLIQELPHVDILINNMGIFEPKTFDEILDEDWFRFFETNVMSGVRLARHYLPKMKVLNWGRIIFVSSESGVNIPVEMIHYGMTKSAQLAISRGLAETTLGSQITVNAVLPGPTRSEGVTTFIENLAKEQQVSVETMEHDFFQTARPSSLLRRFIKTEEVANLIAYVASPLSSATNGAALRVDGGVVRSLV